MNFWTRLDEVRERWDVLEHPFYVRWSHGGLSVQELAFYSEQYRHAVVALASATEAAAWDAGPGLSELLAEHARDERLHIGLWDQFMAAVGGDPAAPAIVQTSRCVEVWSASGTFDLAERLVMLYAIESAQPAISQTKCAGLAKHYGIDAAEATEYFRLHAELDREHAEQDRLALAECLADADEDALMDAAERALAGNWLLLDGVEIESWSTT